MSTLSEFERSEIIRLSSYPSNGATVAEYVETLLAAALVAEGQTEAWLDPKSLGIPLQHEPSAAAPSLHKDAKRDFKGRFLVSGMFDYEDGSKRIAMKLWDVSLESLEPAALHKEGLPSCGYPCELPRGHSEAHSTVPEEVCKCKPVMIEAGDATWGDTDTTQCLIHGAALHKEGPRDERERDYGAQMYQRGRREMRDEVPKEGAGGDELCECGQPENSIRHSFTAASSVDAHAFKPSKLRYCGRCNQRRYFVDGKCEMCAPPAGRAEQGK